MSGVPGVIIELGRRAARAQQRLPVLADVAVVVFLLAALLPGRVGDLVNTGDARLFSVALILPLLLRRRRPVPVFSLLVAVAAGQWLADVRALGDFALLVALYGVAVSQPLRHVALAYAVVEAGVVAAALRWGVDGPDTLHAFVGLTGLSTAATVMGTSTRNRRALVLSLQERAERLETERDQQGRLSAAAERARIARELHDIVAHNVSVMIALADGASYAVDEEPERARHAMQQTSLTGRQALTEMRRLLGVLREDEPGGQAREPQPGLAQLDALLEQVRSAGLPVAYESVGNPAPLSLGLQLAVYRIVQEALTNTLKHAGPGAG
ncbi:MAG: putative two-component sensor, partial [Solirubrobacterales bacterium]|nr:putative two-component sensor [Solirubrobacterales bacterium]